MDHAASPAVVGLAAACRVISCSEGTRGRSHGAATEEPGAKAGREECHQEPPGLTRTSPDAVWIKLTWRVCGIFTAEGQCF